MVVVEQENKDSWIWFLKQFVDDIGKPEELNLAFISDRQNGLLPAMETLFPFVKHRYCVKHIYNNFKVNHKDMELKSVLWRCANTTSAREFEREMDHLKSLDEEAWKYLANVEPAQWTRSHFSSRALTDCMINNLSESFNSMIVKARDKPILSMLEWIRVRLISRLYIKKTGIPCKHGVAAIFVNREKPEYYIHPCYYKDVYVETYKTPIPPMPGQSEWMSSGQPKPIAPIVYKPPGRPPMKRKRDADELNL
nr:uncharacterized protein LOC112024601 [Quercus suber]